MLFQPNIYYTTSNVQRHAYVNHFNKCSMRWATTNAHYQFWAISMLNLESPFYSNWTETKFYACKPLLYIISIRLGHEISSISMKYFKLEQITIFPEVVPELGGQKSECQVSK